MHIRSLFIVPLILLADFASAQEPFTAAGDWWRAPAAADRHTTLVCSFSGGTGEADSARGDVHCGGFGMCFDQPGAQGKAATVSEMGGHLHYTGGSNFQPDHGTVRFAIKGDIWQTKDPLWVFETRGDDRTGLRLAEGKLSLIVGPGQRSDNVLAQLDLPFDEVKADAWHWILASWDRAAGQGWLALDGKGVSGPMKLTPGPRPAFVIYLGGGATGRLGSLAPAGLALDEFVLYDLPLSLLERKPPALAAEDAELLLKCEAGARKTLNFIAGLQRWGGWITLYTWPTLLGSTAQGREFVDFDDYVDNDKGNASCPIAATMLYAYETLGDARYLEAALRTGEFILAAQDPRGFWVHGYRMTVHGITPAANEENIKLQDRVQAHPLLLLTLLHRATGDARYLAAFKRGADFYLKAQNPNGSWSHHYDAKANVGRNAIGEVGGGELNDLCTNDAIDAMALAYHVTKNAECVRAMKRAGEWLIAAQGTKTPLWAYQYDAQNRPAWARAFEPPAYAGSATIEACQALRELYRFSGDARYLEPVRKAAAWLAQNYPDDKVPFYLDPESGKAIAAWDRKIYFLDDPLAVAYLKTVPIGRSYAQTSAQGAALKRLLQDAERGKPVIAPVTVESAAASLAGLRAGAQVALSSQNEQGLWITPKVADFMGSIGAGFAVASPRVRNLLRYAEAARIVMGEIPPAYRGGGDFRAYAYPYPDWYEVDWAACNK